MHFYEVRDSDRLRRVLERTDVFLAPDEASFAAADFESSESRRTTPTSDKRQLRISVYAQSFW